MFFILVAMGAIAGFKNGVPGVFVGALVMIVGLGPFYLWGCYARAKLSDRMIRRGDV